MEADMDGATPRRILFLLPQGARLGTDLAGSVLGDEVARLLPPELSAQMVASVGDPRILSGDPAQAVSTPVVLPIHSRGAQMLRKVVKGLGVLVLAVVLLAGGYVAFAVNAYGRSMSRPYDLPLPALERSTDPLVIERGRHLAESVAGCASGDCHGTDLGGGTTIDVGPVGSVTGPNLTAAGVGGAYSDAELARIIQHGVKRDGRSARFMPSQDFSWLPDADVVALISYLRSVPPVQRTPDETHIGLLGKVLDRRDLMVIDVARRIDHERGEQAPPPEPTARYGAFLARGCVGCHGEGLSGGKIPGAPASMPIPTNITSHETGIRDWSFEDFERLLNTGTRPNGTRLDPFMPYESYAKMDDTEKRALWEFLRSVPPLPIGSR